MASRGKQKAQKGQKSGNDGLRQALQAIKPLVTDAEVEQARQTMQNGAMLKKMRSNMSHALKQKGVYDAYMESPMPERRNFLETDCAHELKTNQKARQFSEQLA